MFIREETLDRMTTSQRVNVSCCIDEEIYRRANRELALYGISVDEAIQFAIMRVAREGKSNFLFEGIDIYAFERI